MSIYKDMLQAGIQIDHHESDLYVPANEITKRIILQRLGSSRHNSVTRFRNQIDGQLWFDIPFAYEPWWEARAK